MKRNIFAALALAFASVAFAQPMPPAPSPPEIEVIPAPEAVKALELKADVAVPLTLSFKGATDKTRWKLIDADNAAIFTCDGGRKCTFIARKAGVYRLTAITGEKDYDVAITAGNPPPVVPVVPPVTDPLVAKFQLAYAAAPDAAKLKILQTLYVGGVDLMNSDAAPTTTADLVGRLRSSAGTLHLAATDLETLRKVIADELKNTLPSTSIANTEDKARAVACLTRVRDALLAVK